MGAWEPLIWILTGLTKTTMCLDRPPIGLGVKPQIGQWVELLIGPWDKNPLRDLRGGPSYNTLTTSLKESLTEVEECFHQENR
jgi:hypothetical protein